MVYYKQTIQLVKSGTDTRHVHALDERERLAHGHIQIQRQRET